MPALSSSFLRLCCVLMPSPLPSSPHSLSLDQGGVLDPHFIKILVVKLKLVVFAPSDYVMEACEPSQH